MPEAFTHIESAGIEEISSKQVGEILDRRAKRYFSLTGQQFLEKWKQGEFTGPPWECDARLAHLTMLIPFLPSSH